MTAGGRGRRAFTLLELLVVVLVIGLLIAILLPAIVEARRSAMRTVCASRLRDLALACNAYLADHGTYPEAVRNTSPALPLPPPLNVVGQVLPQNVQTRLLNEISPYLRYPRLASGAPAADLPTVVESPDVELSDVGRGPFLIGDLSNEYYYTGFIYLGGLGRPAPTPSVLPVSGLSVLGVQLLKPGEAASSAHASGRSVLWADDVEAYSSGARYWQYAHARSGAAPGPQPFTYSDGAHCLGQHRAHCDGSVDWVGGSEMQLGAGSQPPSLLDSWAAYKIGSVYWWF